MRWLAFLIIALPVSATGGELLPPETAMEEVVDRYIDAGLAANGVNSAPPADDANFLRRVTLDLAGRIPSAAETKEFLAATDPSKRQQLVDRLLSSPDFAY